MPRLRHTIEQILAKLREIEIGEQVAWLMTPTTITSRSESAGAGGIGNIQGGFKFQVQRVNDGAGAHRLPGAWQS